MDDLKWAGASDHQLALGVKLAFGWTLIYVTESSADSNLGKLGDDI